MNSDDLTGLSLDDLHQECLVRGYTDETVKRAERWLADHNDPDDTTFVPAELMEAMRATVVNGTALTERAADAATIHYWSDREPATVVKRTAKTITVQVDKATALTKVPYGRTPEYRYDRNTDGPTKVFSLRRNGRWIAKGSPMKGPPSLTLGWRNYYRDPHF